MPDIPLEIEGNPKKFTVSTRGTLDPVTKRRIAGTSKTLAVDPGGAPLQLNLTNKQGVNLTVALGEKWVIVIGAMPKPAKRSRP